MIFSSITNIFTKLSDSYKLYFIVYVQISERINNIQNYKNETVNEYLDTFFNYIFTLRNVVIEYLGLTSITDR